MRRPRSPRPPRRRGSATRAGAPARAAGRWRRKVRANHVDVEVVTFWTLDDAELAALHAEADRYAAAHGRAATLAVAAV